MKYLSTVLLLGLLAGCSSSNQPSTPSTSDNHIIGVVSLMEMDCSNSASFAGVTVQVVGTNYQTTTDNTGTWQIDNMPAGVYTFKFSKPGFTHFIESGISFPGGTMYWAQMPYTPVRLARLNNFTTTLDTAIVTRYISQGDTSFNISFPKLRVTDSTGAALAPNVYEFAGRKPTVSSSDTSSYFTYNNAQAYPLYVSLRYHHMTTGDTVYIVAYPSNCGVGQINYVVGNTYTYDWAGFGPPSQVKAVVLR